MSRASSQTARFRPGKGLIEIIDALADNHKALLLVPEDGPDQPGPTEEPPAAVGLDVVHVPTATLLGESTALQSWVAAHSPSVGLIALLSPLGRPSGLSSRHDMSELACANLLQAFPSCELVLSLPRVVLAGSRRQPLMEEITRQAYLDLVVELPGPQVMSGVHSGLRLGVVHISRQASSSTVMFRLTDVKAEDFRGQLQRLRAGEVRTANGFTIPRADLDPRVGLLPSLVDPERARRAAEAKAIGQLARLDQLCDVIRGPNPALHPPPPHDERKPGDEQVLTGRNVRSDRLLIDQDIKWGSPESGIILQPGDIIVRAINGPSSPLVAAEVSAADLPLLAGHTLIVIRPREPMRASLRRMIRAFIESRRFALQLPSRVTGGVSVPPRELAKAMVPVPDENLLASFEAVESAIQDFQRWKNEGQDILDSSFDADDLDEARGTLIAASSGLRQRADAARLLDDLGHRVSTRFPLPVAYRWRSAVAARGTHEELGKLLDAQEVLLSYLGVLGLVFAHHYKTDIKYINGIRDQLLKGKRGIGLGDWRGILRETAEANAFKRLPASQPLVELRTFFADVRVTEASNTLSQLRNDRSHLRELSPSERDSSMEIAWSCFEDLINASEFITEYPLIRIMDTHWDSFERKNDISVRALTGDSPIVPISRMSHTSNEVEKDSLYIRTARGELLLLRPLLLGKECPSCGHWSTFVPDRLSRSGETLYKSLEHGHPITLASEEARSLAEFGLR